jgi:hypothetical protein
LVHNQGRDHANENASCLFYEFTVMNSLGITVWHSEFELPPQPLFLFDMADFTPPTSYCYDDPGVTFVLSA